MTNKDITKIFFRGNEIAALYQGSTLIFKKSSGGGSTTEPTGVYKIKGTVTKSSGNTQFNLFYNNGQRVNVKVNKDFTFETDLQEPLTNANAMFRGRSYLETLDLNGLDTSQVTDMTEMFSQSNYLKDIKLSSFDTSNVNYMSSMFNNCSGLTSLDLSNFDTSNVMNMQYMFGWCDTLVNLYINFDTSNVTNYDYFDSIFIRDIKLENVVGKFEGTKNNLDLSYCPLTADSAMVFINGLATVTEKRRLSLNATTYDSLTPEQIAIATAKGWTVTRS